MLPRRRSDDATLDGETTMWNAQWEADQGSVKEEEEELQETNDGSGMN